MTQREETIAIGDAWVREARAYLQALIDASDHHRDAATMASYADRLAQQHAYPNAQQRTKLRDQMTGFLAGYSAGWDAGQTHGYQNGMADGIMVTERGGDTG